MSAAHPNAWRYRMNNAALMWTVALTGGLVIVAAIIFYLAV